MRTQYAIPIPMTLFPFPFFLIAEKAKATPVLTRFYGNHIPTATAIPIPMQTCTLGTFTRYFFGLRYKGV